VRPRRHVRRPPDLTSLFDVLFIVVFAALIRAAAVENAAAHPPAPPGPSAPAPPPAVAVLHQRALVAIDADLAARAPLVVRITAAGVVEALETGAVRSVLDTPLLEPSADADKTIAYLGDRSRELQICRIAAVHLGATDLSRYLVIIAPASPVEDLPHALFQGLYRDVDRCLSEQRGIAVVIPPDRLPAALPPSQRAAPAPPATPVRVTP
jgi:hypothetical protein